MKTIVIITAAGQGKRMGGPKQFLEIAGQPMLGRTIAAFEACPLIEGIILVVNEDYIEQAKQFKFSKILKVIAGGKERQDSVYNGIKALPAETEIVAIHDGARPFVTVDIIERSINEAKKSRAVVVGVPVKDTIKQVANSQVAQTLDRKTLWAAQTPQVFKKELLVQAYESGYNKGVATDDAMLVEQLSVPVTMVVGSYQNIKVTTPEDLKFAEGLMGRK